MAKKDISIKNEPFIPSPEALLALVTELPESLSPLFKRVFALDNGSLVAAAVYEANENFIIRIATNLSGTAVLHWGVYHHSPQEWIFPPEELHPPNTISFNNQAAQTAFSINESAQSCTITFSSEKAPLGINCLLHDPTINLWAKEQGRNMIIPVRQAKLNENRTAINLSSGITNDILAAETSNNSWTLMHRFNLCHDLLDRAQSTDDFMTIYVWMRFSAIRQLTWQRNYNTQPRELSHSQDRLTQKLSEKYLTGSDQTTKRLICETLALVGRGGDGQKIRDEILNIMHRHRIKEVSGHFIEEWHQKLHNNTTPDDVVICEAYIAFFKSDGKEDIFYKVCNDGGISKNRLENYERPITSKPDFIPHLKDALIHEFSQFLQILKEVHSGEDLHTSIKMVEPFLTGELIHNLRQIQNNFNHSEIPVAQRCKEITDIRQSLQKKLRESQNGVRELLYLDISLSSLLRTTVESSLHKLPELKQQTDLLHQLLINIIPNYDSQELPLCQKHWERLAQLPARELYKPQETLSAAERLSRLVESITDSYYRLIQKQAEFLGKSFKAEKWSIELFGEEVARGNLLFIISALLHSVNNELRKQIHTGDWQIISSGNGYGTITSARNLASVQLKKKLLPLILIIDKLSAEEEIPTGIAGVITTQSIDILSHLAIRARNAGILVAICNNHDTFKELQALNGKPRSLITTPEGNVNISQEQEPVAQNTTQSAAQTIISKPAAVSTYAIIEKDFTESRVGAKACNLKTLSQKLPDWLQTPHSVALPFGVFEKILALPENSEIAKQHAKICKTIDNAGPDVKVKDLSKIKDIILKLKRPDTLFQSLSDCLQKSGLPLPDDQESAWTSIKQVWASKWNERAVQSRGNRGVPHSSLFMSVLIQEVVPAEYSFVLHTVNPITQNPDELYGEAVAGLGETLVGNYPGRALAFSWNKKNASSNLISFPAKHEGLFGHGLIFRSDSNGEDTMDYAGAGLYDSIMTNPPEERLLDYSTLKLITDRDFLDNFFMKLADVGQVVEKAFDYPQDIEGVYADGKYWVVQSRPQVGIDCSQ
ncbi:MAG: hypothetical protein HQK83_14730 [Fibrobacteria bacterium]|nr:hypothetical protein [Fibrobacteria bacterium]